MNFHPLEFVSRDSQLQVSEFTDFLNEGQRFKNVVDWKADMQNAIKNVKKTNIIETGG